MNLIVLTGLMVAMAQESTTAETPAEAVRALTTEIAGEGSHPGMESGAFVGLPMPAPGIRFTAVRRALDRVSMRLSVTVEAHTIRRVLARRQYVFAIHSTEYVLVPKHILRAGEMIRSDDLRPVELALGGDAQQFALSLDQLVGRIARRSLLAGKPIPKRALKRPSAVKRGDGVTVQVKAGPMLVTMKGEALETGAMGDSVRVLNTSSAQVLVGRVVGHHLVEVVR